MAAGQRTESSSESATVGASPQTSTTNGQVVVLSNQREHDVSSFLHRHPGGCASLLKYNGQDISATMKNTHSPAARYLLASYAQKESPEMENMEKGLDWSKPMLRQVGKLGSRYSTWVECPVDRPLRLFQADVLEVLTKTPWWSVPLVWIPIILFFTHSGWTSLATPDRLVRICELVGCLFSGVLLWTLIEYTLHRWVFHAQPPTWSRGLITAHFLIHGLHHKVPFDRFRLVFPPVPAAMIAFIIYNLIALFVSRRFFHAIFAGGLTGYVAYDMIHYYLHYGSPDPDNYLYKMKRYHNRHHFSHQNTGFGISSDFWDRIFNTEIFLEKLKNDIEMDDNPND